MDCEGEHCKGENYERKNEPYVDCEGDVHVRLWAAFISYTVSLPRHTSKSENEIQNETETWKVES